MAINLGCLVLLAAGRIGLDEYGNFSEGGQGSIGHGDNQLWCAALVMVNRDTAIYAALVTMARTPAAIVYHGSDEQPRNPIVIALSTRESLIRAL